MDSSPRCVDSATTQRVLLIVDEIQSGLGRTGAMFAYVHEGIRPDGVIVGKALGGGLLPVSAFVARAQVLDLMEPGQSRLDVRRQPARRRESALEALLVLAGRADSSSAAASSASTCCARLRRLDSPLIRAVRGRGLWVGVELDRRA